MISQVPKQTELSQHWERVLSEFFGSDVYVQPRVNNIFGKLDAAISMADTSEKLEIIDQIDMFHKAKLQQFANNGDPPSRNDCMNSAVFDIFGSI